MAFYEQSEQQVEFDPKDIEANKVVALFSYIGFLFLIPVLGAPQSKYARFHADQGIALFIVELVLSFLISIVTKLVGFIGNSVSLISGLAEVVVAFLGLVSGAVWIVYVVFAVLGIVNAVTGKAKELPVIGKIKILK